MVLYWTDEDTLAQEQAWRRDEERRLAKGAGSIVIECEKGCWDILLRKKGESAIVREWGGSWYGLNIEVATAPVAIYDKGTDGRPLPARRTVSTTVAVKSHVLPNDTLYYAKPEETLEQAVKSAVKEALRQLGLLPRAMTESEKW